MKEKIKNTSITLTLPKNIVDTLQEISDDRMISKNKIVIKCLISDTIIYDFIVDKIN